MIEIYSDMRNFSPQHNPEPTQREFENFSNPIKLYLGMSQVEYDSIINGMSNWSDRDWTNDQGRAECFAYGVFGKDDGVVIGIELDKKYIIGAHWHLEFFRPDIDRAISDGCFNYRVMSTQPSKLLDEFVKEETYRRFH